MRNFAELKTAGVPSTGCATRPFSMPLTSSLTRSLAERLAFSNGLSLCKLTTRRSTHSLLGITPDLVVRLDANLLDEKDGPMLEHGLRAFEGTQLVVPEAPEDRPDRELRAERWRRFGA